MNDNNDGSVVDRSKTSVENDEMRKLRFNYHKTAFDVDIDALDDHAWRNKNIDLLDYFNYGFNEKIWMVSSVFLSSLLHP